jgi:SAM-dependent methyltransferase
MSTKDIEELKQLYAKQSKHSNYQKLSRRLERILDGGITGVKSRHEEERLEYILKNLDVKDKRILDVGGNTGYFTFEFIDNAASCVEYYEGNEAHVKFVELAAKVLNIDENIIIKARYLNFDDDLVNNRYDIVLLLNVLHHLGDDYGDKNISIGETRKKILCQLNGLSENAKKIVFQLGYNWKGNREKCLFENGTKAEMIDYIRDGTRNYWEIEKIGIAEEINGKIKYTEMCDSNLKRNDQLGEFLNRPIFILRSLKYGQ